MKRLIALLALCSLSISAQELEHSLLWKVSGNGLKAPSFLYGTIHITCDNTLDAATLKALDDTKQLYLELDMDDPGMMAAMIGSIAMQDGVTMEQLASEDDFRITNDFFKKQMGMGLELMHGMKPLFVSMMLLPAQLGCTPKSVEEALIAVVKQQGEETLGLESVEEQMKIFDAIPYKVQMDELVKTAKSNASADKKELDQLMSLYKAKDLDAMVRATLESENKTTSEYGDVLLKDRNAKWIPEISEIAKEKPTFFGVGAAHLGGPDGVIRLLRKAGFKVEAVH